MKNKSSIYLAIGLLLIIISYSIAINEKIFETININATIKHDELPHYTLTYASQNILSEYFEITNIGLLPFGWLQNGGTNDTASVTNQTSYNGKQSLHIHESFGDLNSSRIEVITSPFNTSDYTEINFYMKIKEGRGVIQLNREDGQHVFMLNCFADSHWQHWTDYGVWQTLNKSSASVDTWHKVSIIIDSQGKRYRAAIDNIGSGWIPTILDWNQIQYITFRGNDNFSGDFWIDDLTINNLNYPSPITQNTEWPMFRYKPNHEGSLQNQSILNIESNWEYATNGSVHSSPAIANNHIYIGSTDNKIYCLDSETGQLVWGYTTNGSIYSSPAVSNNRVYIGSDDQNLYCLNETTGTPLWKYPTHDKIRSSPAIYKDYLYFGSFDSNIYCINANSGILEWKYTTGNLIRSCPTIYENKLYINSYDNKTYCLNASTGTVNWVFSAENWIKSSPAVTDNHVYFGSHDENIYCLDAETGNLVWKYKTNSSVRSSPAIVQDRLYIGSDDGYLYCLDSATGDLVWRYKVGSIIRPSPAATGISAIIGSDDNTLYCIEITTGKLLWSYETEGIIRSSPAIYDGKIFFGSYDQKVHCLTRK